MLWWNNYFAADIDDCAINPCQNGANCEDGINEYRCECEPGWQGTNCEQSKLTYQTLND